MTAKSETVGVVAVLHRNESGQIYWTTTAPLPDLRLGGYVHESALAELREQCVNWQGAAGQYKAELLAAELRITTIISGLEALAGEWERRAKAYADDTENQGAVSGRNGYWFQGASEVSEQFASAIRRALIPAAANTESEEVKP